MHGPDDVVAICEHGEELMADEPTDLSEERRMIEPKHGARPMADVIDAVTRFRPNDPPRYTGDDPALLAISKLPLQASLATRVRTMIEAGASDLFVDCYIAAWIDSARTDVEANRDLHFALARYLGGRDG